MLKPTRALTAVAVMGIMLGGCHNAASSARAAVDETELAADDEDANAANDDAGHSEEAADDDTIRGGETYNEYDARRDELNGSNGTFDGNGCTVDCGGHQAGYDWAEAHGITDPDECGGNSWSFNEGCRSYAEEQQREDERTGEDGSGAGE